MGITTTQAPVITMNKVNEEVMNFARSSLSALLGGAPYDSFIKMSIDAAKPVTTVALDLCSLPFRTSISKVATSPYMAIEKAISELQVNIAKWKATRFEPLT
jgi:hypothetical protein